MNYLWVSKDLVSVRSPGGVLELQPAPGKGRTAMRVMDENGVSKYVDYSLALKKQLRGNHGGN